MHIYTRLKVLAALVPLVPLSLILSCSMNTGRDLLSFVILQIFTMVILYTVFLSAVGIARFSIPDSHLYLGRLPKKDRLIYLGKNYRLLNIGHENKFKFVLIIAKTYVHAFEKTWESAAILLTEKQTIAIENADLNVSVDLILIDENKNGAPYFIIAKNGIHFEDLKIEKSTS